MAVNETQALAYSRGFDSRIAAVVSEAARRVPVFATRLADSGLAPGDVDSVAALDRLAILRKDELVELQSASPPFGGLLAPDATVRRIFQSPGPLYEPELGVDDPWGWTPALRAAGFGPDDLVLNAFGYHLTPAGAMLEQAAFTLGARVVPGGVGSLELQARACRDLAITAYVGLPSYLKALLERADELGLDPAGWALERAFVSAEPLPPSLRAWLEERLAVVQQGYGTAEAGNLGYECECREGLHLPLDRLVQVCDLTTGSALWGGEEGEVVVTLLSADYPLVRFGTGDISAMLADPCPCGNPAPRIAGWLGRSGEAVKVRGLFLHPRQARSALAGVPGLDAFRLVVERVDHRDVLRCEILPASRGDVESVTTNVREQIRAGLRFDAEVSVVDELDPAAPAIVDLRVWD